MRARPVLVLIAGASLACGFLKPKAPPEPVATPTPAPSASPTASGNPDFGSAQNHGVLAPDVTTVGPDVAPGAVLAAVKSDYEYLHDAGKIDACPDGTTLHEKVKEDNNSTYCALPNDVRHGPWMNFWPNGKVREIGPYVGGYREGVFTTWDMHGKMTSRYTWKNNQPGDGHVF